MFQAARDLELDFGAALKQVRNQFDVRNEADTLFIYSVGGAVSDSIIDIYRIMPEYEVNNTMRSTKAAAYAQASWQVSGRIRMTAGLRSDYFEFTKFLSWSPRLGISWEMIDWARELLAVSPGTITTPFWEPAISLV